MEKKREDILLPLGFNATPITSLAYGMKLKDETKKELEAVLEKHKKETETMLENFRTTLLQEIREELKKHDTGWTKL